MSTDARAAEWIGVADVAAELKISERAAWELIRRLGVGCTARKPATARFRRSEFAEKLERGLEPPEARKPYVRTAPPKAAASAPPPAPAKKAGPRLSKLRGA